MIARAIREWALAVAAVAVAYGACVIAVHLSPWCQDASETLATLPSMALSGKYAAEQGALASTETINFVGSGKRAIDHSTELIDEATRTIVQGREAAKNARIAWGGRAARIDALINQYATVPSTFAKAMEPLPELQHSLSGAADSAGSVADATAAYIRGPLSFSTNNLGELSDSVNTSVQHVNQRWLRPWDGKNPFKHYTIEFLKGSYGLAKTGGVVFAAR